MARVSSGMKIVGARDDAARFAISEKMREQIRSLLQDNQNVQNGSSMIKVAERGIDQIVQLLDNMKQLAIDAANDSNIDEDRRTIQKEFDSRAATINDIAIGTEYNGQKLLDGTWAKKTIIHTPGSSGGSGGTDPTALPDDYESIYVDVAEPVQTFHQISATTSQTFDVTEDGIYVIDADFHGTINIADSAQNVTFRRANSSAPLQNVSIVAPSGGNANVRIENMAVNNSVNQSFIKFQGSGNVLTVKGSNTFNSTIAEDYITVAAINSGSGLNVQGYGSASTLTINNYGDGAGIGSDSGGSAGNIGLVNLNFEINAGDGAAVGSGTSNASVGDITVENSTGTFTGGTNSCIGSGYGNSSAGNILVVASTIIDTSSVDAGIGSGYYESTCGDITIRNSYVEVNNSDSPAIGAGDAQSTCGDIYISNSEINCSSYHGAAVGTGLGGKFLGAIQISSSSIIDASRAYLDPEQVPPYSGIGKGRGGDASNIGDVEDIQDTEDPTDSTTYVETVFNPLWIQHGTQSGQRIHCYINSMQTKDLRGTIPNEADEAQLAALDYDQRKQTELRAIISAAADMTLDDAKVNTVDNANIAIRVVEGALEYALNEATTQGAYLQRLEYRRRQCWRRRIETARRF